MGYKTIIPATDWYFVIDAVSPQTEQIVWPLAVWALTDDDQVIGLVGVRRGGPEDNAGRTPALVAVPPLRGTYKPSADLTPEERRLAGVAAGSTST